MSKRQHTAASAAVGIEHAIRMLEGRWKLVILFHLFGGRKMRFSDLERAIPAISQKMLIQQLRQLERDGIVARIVHAQVPPKVDYHLTNGRTEIYVERYPELGSRQQVSTDGGARPLWSRNGRELFFSSQDGRQMLAVPVQTGTTFVAGRPQVLFESAIFMGAGNRPYDIAPDGRFIIILGGQAEPGGGTAWNMILVKNWFEELKRSCRRSDRWPFPSGTRPCETSPL
jgi:DNA-binding HxlR family transcriptional regulator